MPDFTDTDYPAQITVAGNTFASVLQYVLYQKATVLRDFNVAKQVRQATTGEALSQLSRAIFPKGVDLAAWWPFASRYLDDANLAKFQQHGQLQAWLLASGTSPIVVNRPSEEFGAELEAQSLVRARELLLRLSAPPTIPVDETPEPVPVAHKIDACFSWDEGHCRISPKGHWMADLKRLPQPLLIAELLAYQNEIGLATGEGSCFWMSWVDHYFGITLDKEPVAA